MLDQLKKYEKIEIRYFYYFTIQILWLAEKSYIKVKKKFQNMFYKKFKQL